MRGTERGHFSAAGQVPALTPDIRFSLKPYKHLSATDGKCHKAKSTCPPGRIKKNAGEKTTGRVVVVRMEGSQLLSGRGTRMERNLSIQWRGSGSAGSLWLRGESYNAK